ncbi:MAG: DUF6599 family protein [Candidatus Aminicenantales bacterium]
MSKIAGALIVALMLGAAAPAQERGPLSGLIPRTSIPAGWTAKGAPQEFEGDDLFIYIDGGADIYQEYGFVRTAVQDYSDGGGRSVSLEIFEMTDAGAAFGMYTFKTTGKGEPHELGRSGQIEDYYLNFWKGRYLYTITGFDDAPETVRGLLAVGKAADFLAPAASGSPPALIRRLPAEGLDARSVKYVRGRIGLANIFPPATRGNLFVNEAVRADYGSGQLFLFECGGTDGTEKTMNALAAVLAGAPSFQGYRESGGRLSAEDDRGTLYIARAIKGLVLVTSGLDPEAADKLMAGVGSGNPDSGPQ